MKTSGIPASQAGYERAFVFLVALFVGCLVVCNLIVQKFFLWEPFGIRDFFYLSVGILPYPVTFLVTDVISECYGKRRANEVVMAGLVVSVLVVGVVFLADHVHSIGGVNVDTGEAIPGSDLDFYFHQIFGRTGRAVLASMVAYLLAQLVDIQIFHFWRRVTRGKHLWLRNNGSTILSQLLDSTLVVTLLFAGTEMAPRMPQMILSGWVFKMLVALADTPFFYAAVWYYKRWFPEQVQDHDDLRF